MTMTTTLPRMTLASPSLATPTWEAETTKSRSWLAFSACLAWVCCCYDRSLWYHYESIVRTNRGIIRGRLGVYELEIFWQQIPKIPDVEIFCFLPRCTLERQWRVSESPQISDFEGLGYHYRPVHLLPCAKGAVFSLTSKWRD
jgi:hypothetical protein